MPIGITAVLVVGAAGVAIAVGDGDGDDQVEAGPPGAPRVTVTPDSRPQARPATRTDPRRPVPTLVNQPRHGRFFGILSVRDGARVPLFAAPGERLIRSLSARSEFGSPRVLAVARQRGSWLGVTTPLRRDGQLGWVRFDEAKLNLYWTRYSLRVELSERAMELRYGDRLLKRYSVTVGAAGSETPPGRFSVTDALDFGNSPYYGCCALALSGHQDNLPVDWLGGDRIAIHGTPGPVGQAASYGCIRATDETMRTLFRRVPLGTPVFVDS